LSAMLVPKASPILSIVQNGAPAETNLLPAVTAAGDNAGAFIVAERVKKKPMKQSVFLQNRSGMTVLFVREQMSTYRRSILKPLKDLSNSAARCAPVRCFLPPRS
jgi:hypothetical protein